MMNNLKLTHKGLILVSVPLFFQIIFILALGYFLTRTEDAARKIEKSRTLITEAGQLSVLFYDAGICLWAYKLGGSQNTSGVCDDLFKKIESQIVTLESLIKDQPDQYSAFEQLRFTTEEGLKILRHEKDSQDTSPFNTPLTKIVALTHHLIILTRQIVYRENERQALEPKTEAHFRGLVKTCLFAGFIFNIAIAVALAIFFNTGTISRLAVVLNNLKRFGKAVKLLPPLNGNDEIKILDTAFRDMAEALTEARRKEQEIMNMVSHDLRSPLTSLQFSLDILASGSRGPISEAGLNDIALAKTNISQLMKLVNYLLETERLASSALGLNLTEISVDSFIGRSIESLQSWAQDRDIKINYSPTEIYIEGDFERLLQVMINLLSNAIKFSPSHGEIKISAQKENSSLIVKVIDQGPGISEMQQSELFKPFHQLNNYGKETFPSSGLGLSISKNIIESHQGIIGVTSHEGGGSTFWFRLPSVKPIRST